MRLFVKDGMYWCLMNGANSNISSVRLIYNEFEEHWPKGCPVWVSEVLAGC